MLATESTFAHGNEGWTVIDHLSSTNPLPANGIRLTDPNPSFANGRLRVQDIASNWNWLVAPSKFHGDWSGFDHLEIDLITDDAPTAFNLRLFISDGTSTASFEFPLGGTPGGSVLNLSAPLLEAQWQVAGNWATLLANVNAFYVRVDLNNAVAAEADFIDRIALVGDNNPPSRTFPVTFPTELGYSYQVESSIDLQNWRNVGTPVAGTGQEIQVDVILSDAPECFYRAHKLQHP